MLTSAVGCIPLDLRRHIERSSVIYFIYIPNIGVILVGIRAICIAYHISHLQG